MFGIGPNLFLPRGNPEGNACFILEAEPIYETVSKNIFFFISVIRESERRGGVETLSR